MSKFLSICLICLRISLGLQQQCPEDEDGSFAVVSGYAFSPLGLDSVIDTKVKIPSLADCLGECKKDAACQAVSYDVLYDPKDSARNLQLCVLFSKKPESQGILCCCYYYCFFLLLSLQLCFLHETNAV